MWGVGAAGFFLGIDRLSLRSMGRKGCLFAVLILVAGFVALWFLDHWFGFYGFVGFVAVALAAAWISIGRFEKKNKARMTALKTELRRATVADSDFRLGVDSSLQSGTEGSGWMTGSDSGPVPSDTGGRPASPGA